MKTTTQNPRVKIKWYDEQGNFHTSYARLAKKGIGKGLILNDRGNMVKIPRERIYTVRERVKEKWRKAPEYKLVFANEDNIEKRKEHLKEHYTGIALITVFGWGMAIMGVLIGMIRLTSWVNLEVAAIPTAMNIGLAPLIIMGLLGIILIMIFAIFAILYFPDVCYMMINLYRNANRQDYYDMLELEHTENRK